jgi:GDP-mannose 6-dehydrogenase
VKIVVVGLGYVGAVTAASFAQLGHDVVGVETDSHKVDLLAQGKSPIVEPKLDQMVASGVQSGRLKVSTGLTGQVASADAVLICVGTPSLADGSVDLSYVERVAEQIGDELAGSTRFTAVVLRRTVPPGTVNAIVVPALERRAKRRVSEDFGAAMCPEFLREGSGVDDFFSPPFTVVGAGDPRTGSLLTELFAPLGAPVHVVAPEQAESLKYACNAFHAVKVTFANEIGRLLGSNGVDARRVMEIFVADEQLNISSAYLRPGFAFGGSCLPKDLRALVRMARIQDVDVPLLSSLLASNESHLRRVARRVLSTGEREVALLGLSFKTDTDDLRESPYVELAEILLGKGMQVRVFDPVVHPENLFGTNLRFVDAHLPHVRRMLEDTPDAALDGANVAVVGVDDPSINAALLRAQPAMVLDLSGRLDPAVEALPGYEGVAW